MHKFPSIEQFRNVVKFVTMHGATPVLTFEGTVKLHGTNAGVQVHPDGTIVAQSRNRVITPEDDNLGFAAWVASVDPAFFRVIAGPQDRPVTIFGEWCGQGIQRGVAISELPRMFVVFALGAPADGERTEWLAYNETTARPDIRFALRVGTIDIDFARPTASQQALVELTEAVERQCPFGASLGVAGVGEGVVWRCTTPGYETSDHWFKVKGEKHSATKVKTLASVDPEHFAAVEEFVAATVTPGRVAQGIAYLVEQGLPVDRTSTGPFLSWMAGDVQREEADTLVASGLEWKAVGGQFGKVARRAFFDAIDLSS